MTAKLDRWSFIKVRGIAISETKLAVPVAISGFPGDTNVKNPPANAGDIGDGGSVPGWGRSPGEGNGYPLQHPCLKNPTDRGGWWAMVHEVTQSQTRLSAHREAC